MNKELIEKIIAYNYNEFGAEYGDALVDLKHENEWLHHIIKEVREYIEENTNSDSFTVLTSGKITDIPYCIVAFEDILEILDKGDKDGER